jgi:starch phosphorylase
MQLRNLLVYPRYPEELDRLLTLAYNYWTLWDKDGTALFRKIDPGLFRASGENPVGFLHTLPDERVRALAQDGEFLADLDRVWNKYQAYSESRTEYSPVFDGHTVAYFSMEYGLHASLPIFAGGLGILAGDHLKGASDLDIPITAVGLFYRSGYFRQYLSADGTQREESAPRPIYDLGLKELSGLDGRPVSIELHIRQQPLRVRAWLARVGRVRLLLLDTNLEDNPPEMRGITENLYDARREVRFMQEFVLGFGGVRALQAAGVHPSVYHLNEGHSSFMILERLRQLVQDEKMTLPEARALVTSTTVFTTHTPVEAGNENYPAEFVASYLEREVESLGMSMGDFLRCGSLHNSDTFWLPAFAIRFSRYVNGVSRLHGQVSRNMWKDLFPSHITREVPITHVTNGVHDSWLSGPVRDLLARHMDEGRLNCADPEALKEAVYGIPDQELWETHLACKRDMIQFLRRRMKQAASGRGYFLKGMSADRILNPDFMTVVFARRFAAYKRPAILLTDRERLRSILTDSSRPVQLVYAGKAHPADTFGKSLIKEIIDFARENRLQDRLLFVENYDSLVASYLVQGADVWLNTPLKPFEASGTSGMKAGINGALNLSVGDGWWPECYNGANGWLIDSAMTVENRDTRDAIEAGQIYGLLESEVTRLYYERGDNGVPAGWVAMMKESIYSVLLGFNIHRMLGEYAHRFYIPACRSRQELLKADRAELKKLVARARQVQSLWDKISIQKVSTNIQDRDIMFSGDTIQVECEASLEGNKGGLFSVELFYYRGETQGSDRGSGGGPANGLTSGSSLAGGLTAGSSLAGGLPGAGGAGAHHDYDTIPLEQVEVRDGRSLFRGSMTLTSRGVQGIALRLVPSDGLTRAMYPDLVKWAAL